MKSVSGPAVIRYLVLCALTFKSSISAFASPSSLKQLIPNELHQRHIAIRRGKHESPHIPRGGASIPRFLSSSNANNVDQGTSSETQKKNKLTREFFTIAIPAFVQLAAEPLAGLVDTAYLGRLGPEVLGGAGVAISAQYAMSKLYNDPLLRTSISLVASEDGKRSGKSGSGASEEEKTQALSIAVSSALLLAFTVGMVQLVLYFSFASSILGGMGISSSSPMHYSAYCKF
jgi:hypothetical protein